MRSNVLALSLLLSWSLLVSVQAKRLLLYAYTSFVSDLVFAKLGAVSKCLGKLLLFAPLLTGCILHRHVAIITNPSPPFPVHDVVLIPGILPIFLHGCEIKSGSGLGRGYGTVGFKVLIPTFPHVRWCWVSVLAVGLLGLGMFKNLINVHRKCFMFVPITSWNVLH